MAMGEQAFQTAFAITWIIILSYIVYLIRTRLRLASQIRKLKD